MSKLFNWDSPIINTLSNMADLIILNILHIVCCIPILTIGVSTTALNDAVSRLIRDEGNIVKAYFKALFSNFKQSTVQWVILLLLGIPLALCLYFYINITTSIGQTLLWIAIVFAFFWCSVCSWTFLLQSRFYNSTTNSFRNALLCSIAYLPHTIAIVVMDILPVAFALLFPKMFVYCGIVFFIIWFSLASYIKLKVTKKAFQMLLDKSDSLTPNSIPLSTKKQ